MEKWGEISQKPGMNVVPSLSKWARVSLSELQLLGSKSLTQAIVTCGDCGGYSRLRILSSA